jgi:hypothetical protein
MCNSSKPRIARSNTDQERNPKRKKSVKIRVDPWLVFYATGRLVNTALESRE